MIKEYGSRVLYKECQAIDIDSGELDSSEFKQLVNKLKAALVLQDGLGLAAPQIGVSKRVAAYRNEGEKDIHTLVNPKIIKTSDEMWSYHEGCLSIPGMWFMIERPKTVTIETYDQWGKLSTIKGEEMLGRIFQHEIEHLNGRILECQLDEEQLASLKKWNQDRYSKKKKRKK